MPATVAALKPAALKPAVRQTLSDSVVSSLREAIFSGALPPGRRIAEAVLAAELNVSRAPVREALAQLEQEGLVHRTPGRGAVVVQLSGDDAEEICDLRVALEGLAIRLAAARAGEADFAAMERSVAATGRSARADDLAAEDVRFHDLIVRAAGSKRLLSMWRNLRSQVLLLILQRNLEDGASRRGTAQSHGELLALLRRRDGEGAAALFEKGIGHQRTWFRGRKSAPAAEEAAR